MTSKLLESYKTLSLLYHCNMVMSDLPRASEGRSSPIVSFDFVSSKGRSFNTYRHNLISIQIGLKIGSPVGGLG